VVHHKGGQPQWSITKTASSNKSQEDDEEKEEAEDDDEMAAGGGVITCVMTLSGPPPTTATASAADEKKTTTIKKQLSSMEKDPSEGLFTASESIQIAIHKAVSLQMLNYHVSINAMPFRFHIFN